MKSTFLNLRVSIINWKVTTTQILKIDFTHFSSSIRFLCNKDYFKTFVGYDSSKTWRRLVFFSHENAFRNQNELPNNTCRKVGQNVDETHLLRYRNVIWVLSMMLIMLQNTKQRLENIYSDIKLFLHHLSLYILKIETNISEHFK